jgi:hypothetical protein
MNRLPDELLLEIFDFLLERNDGVKVLNAWQTLVHVCRGWRNVILSSPRRLNLQILCMDTNPVRNMLDIWPAFPIVIVTGDYPGKQCTANVVSAFEQSGRVSEIFFEEISSEALEILSGTMRGPFPQLATLDITLGDTREFYPEPFGIAPHLRSLSLCDVPLSAVVKLLLSASDLVDLSLWHVPIWEYVTPKEIATCLSPMTKLESMSLGFRFPRHYPCPGSQRRTVLPSLTRFHFEGPKGYLEDLKARLDTPRLDRVKVSYSNSPFYAEDIDYLMQYNYE